IPIVEAYGLTELGLVASECARGGGLHLDGDVIAEVVDEDGEPVPDGHIGHLVLTSLRNDPLPLIRYRTGDLAALDRSRCGCGRATPRLVEIAGRAMLNFQLPS